MQVDRIALESIEGIDDFANVIFVLFLGADFLVSVWGYSLLTLEILIILLGYLLGRQ